MNEEGTILVANPKLQDPDFRRSVILIKKHDDKSSVGINIAGLRGHRLDADGYIGGPILMFHGVLFKINEEQPEFPVGNTGWAIAYTMVDSQLAARKEAENGSMFIIGQATWGPRQLLQEINGGCWAVASMTLDELMSVPVEERWARAVEGLTFSR